MDTGDVERDEAAWQRERDRKTPVWRAMLVLDLRMQRRAGPDALAVMAQNGFRYDSRVNAEATCEHLAELAAVDATDGTSLLAVVVEAMPVLVQAETRKDRRILPTIRVTESRPERQRGMMFGGLLEGRADPY